MAALCRPYTSEQRRMRWRSKGCPPRETRARPTWMAAQGRPYVVGVANDVQRVTQCPPTCTSRSGRSRSGRSATATAAVGQINKAFRQQPELRVYAELSKRRSRRPAITIAADALRRASRSNAVRSTPVPARLYMSLPQSPTEEAIECFAQAVAAAQCRCAHGPGDGADDRRRYGARHVETSRLRVKILGKRQPRLLAREPGSAR